MEFTRLKDRKADGKYLSDPGGKKLMATAKKAHSVMLTEEEIRNHIKQQRAGNESRQRIAEQQKRNKGERMRRELLAKSERVELAELHYVHVRVKRTKSEKRISEKTKESREWYSAEIRGAEELFVQISEEWGIRLK